MACSGRQAKTDTALVRPESERPSTPWYRTWKLVAAVGVIVLVVVCGAIVVSETSRNDQSPGQNGPDQVAVADWWVHARDDFTNLRNAVDQTQRALTRPDEEELRTGCQLIHDIAEVSLKAKMPTPNAELTAQIQSMIEDFHSASHMCLSAAAGSTNNYYGEFRSYLEQAQNQMNAAEDRVSTLTQA